MKNVIRELEERVLRETANQLECLLGLDASGTVIFEKVGEPNRIELSSEEMDRLRGVALLTHNHPSGGGIGVGDFDVAVTVDARELNAFSERYRYRVVRPPRGWPPLRGSLEQLACIRVRIEQRLRARIAAGTLSPDEASVQFWHQVWTTYVREHPGVHYVREVRQQ